MTLGHDLDMDKGELTLVTGIHNTMNDVTNIMAQEIVKLKEEAITDALIKLGWTPPHEKDNIRHRN